MIKKPLAVVLFVIQGIPILLYPFVLLADLMQLAGDDRSLRHESIFLIITMYLFIILSATYPITYIVSILLYFIKKNWKRGKIWALIATFIHYAVVILLYSLWSAKA